MKMIAAAVLYLYLMALIDMPADTPWKKALGASTKVVGGVLGWLAILIWVFYQFGLLS
jgi:hypothetical protein